MNSTGPGGQRGRPPGGSWLALSVCGLVVMGATAPLIAWATFAALAAESQTPLEWVRPDFPPRREYDRFSAIFGSGEVAVAT